MKSSQTVTPTQPPYDYETLRHVIETKFIYSGDNSVENPLQISTRKPHHPQYSLKNKRYECGCGFISGKLDYEIIKDFIPSQSRIHKSKSKSSKEPLPNHYDRFTPVMIGADIQMIKYKPTEPYLPKRRTD